VAFRNVDRVELVVPDVPSAPIEFRVPNAIHECVSRVEVADRIAVASRSIAGVWVVRERLTSESKATMQINPARVGT
jgi:hypothetical protein